MAYSAIEKVLKHAVEENARIIKVSDAEEAIQMVMFCQLSLNNK